MKKAIKSKIGFIIIGLTYYIYSRRERSCVWRFIERAYFRFLSVFNLTYMPILSADKYYELTKNVTFSTIRGDRKGVEGNVVYSDEAPVFELYDVDLPDVRLHEYRDVCVAGNSDVVVDRNNGCVVCDECYDMDPDLFFIDGLLYRDKNNIGVLRNNLKRVDTRLDSAIMINGKFSNNYYHQMFENLIRLLLLNEEDVPMDVPIVVDDVVYRKQSFQRIFEILTRGSNRPVVRIKRCQMVSVSRLYYFDHINRIIPHIKRVDIIKRGLVAFDDYYIKMYRDILLAYKSEEETPKRIFLTRANTNHRRFNEDDIFSVLETRGFVKIDMGEKTLEQQMALFNNAEWIVGATGAAFTNVLFCKDGCNIITIRAIKRKTVFPEFSTLANINGCKMVVYLPDSSMTDNTAHTDFYIDKERFENYINSI